MKKSLFVTLILGMLATVPSSHAAPPDDKTVGQAVGEFIDKSVHVTRLALRLTKFAWQLPEPYRSEMIYILRSVLADDFKPRLRAFIATLPPEEQRKLYEILLTR